jgi:hypothetical protein
MPRIKKDSAAPAASAKFPPLDQVEPAGGWVANPENDPLTAGAAHLKQPTESSLEEPAYEEYREDDAPTLPDQGEGDAEPSLYEELVAETAVSPEPEVPLAPVVAEAEPDWGNPGRNDVAQSVESEVQGFLEEVDRLAAFQAPPLTGQEHPVFGATLGDAEFVGKYEDGTPEWHAARAAGIGSSDAACVLDIGFSSAFMLWQYKKGYVVQPSLESDPGMAEILLTGHLREPEIAEKFRRRNPRWSVHEGGSWRKATAPWMLSNPDRILLDEETGEVAILELKSSETGTGYDEGRCPAKYVVQVRHQLWCMGLPYGFLAVVIGNSDYREYYIPADVNQPVVRVFARYGGQVQNVVSYGDGLTMELMQYNFLMSDEPPAYGSNKDIYEYKRQQHLSSTRRARWSCRSRSALLSPKPSS